MFDEELMEQLQIAISRATQEEKNYLHEIQKQIDMVAKVEGDSFDRFKELFLNITFEKEKFTTPAILDVAKKYLEKNK
jgi:hypothetical protein